MNLDPYNLTHPQKLLKIFSRKYGNYKSILEKFLSLEGDRLIDDHFLDSASILNRLECVDIALDLIDDKGKFDQQKQQSWIQNIENSFSLVPGKKLDFPKRKWLAGALKQFNPNWLTKFHLPNHNHFAMQMIRLSLLYAPKKELTDADVKRAVFSAYLSDLRQSLGSCFATAPALYIRKHQPEMFFDDFASLLYKARLERVVEGEQYLIPLSTHLEQAAGEFPFFTIQRLPKKVMIVLCELFMRYQVAKGGLLKQFFVIKKAMNVWYTQKTASATSIHHLLHWLIGHIKESKLEKPKSAPVNATPLQIEKETNLAQKNHALFAEIYDAFCALNAHPLLKVWEYTIASMSDVKLDFNYWNSFHALGFNSEDEGSIAHCMKNHAEEKIAKLQEMIEEIQSQIEQVELYLQSLNARSRNASFETMQHIKGRAASEHARLSRLAAERDAYHKRAQALADHLGEIAKQIGRQFTLAFQEVYDPKIVKQADDLYSDSPAGFRLVYKHQRQDPALWTSIDKQDQYLQFLSHFFYLLITSLQGEVAIDPKDLSDLMHALSQHVNTDLFIHSAKLRCAKRSGLSKEDKTMLPWAYVSGGTMSMLVSLYFSKSTKPTETTKIPKDEAELVDFFLEFILDAPFNLQEQVKKGDEVSFLMHSPTHAFTFDPTTSSFLRGIKSGKYPFSWIRDEMINVATERMKGVKLDGFYQSAFYSKFTATLPFPLLSQITGKIAVVNGSISLQALRENILNHFLFKSSKSMRSAFEDHLDYCLFSFFPLFSGSTAASAIEEVFAFLKKQMSKNTQSAIKKLRELSALELMTKLEVSDLMKSLMINEKNQVHGNGADIHAQISNAFYELGICYQTPFIFADSNWLREKFAFCVNPASLKLELYRVSYTGDEGIPMRSWKKFFGVRDQNKWTIFDHPHEYGY